MGIRGQCGAPEKNRRVDWIFFFLFTDQGKLTEFREVMCVESECVYVGGGGVRGVSGEATTIFTFRLLLAGLGS